MFGDVSWLNWYGLTPFIISYFALSTFFSILFRCLVLNDAIGVMLLWRATQRDGWILWGPVCRTIPQVSIGLIILLYKISFRLRSNLPLLTIGGKYFTTTRPFCLSMFIYAFHVRVPSRVIVRYMADFDHGIILSSWCSCSLKYSLFHLLFSGTPQVLLLRFAMASENISSWQQMLWSQCSRCSWQWTWYSEYAKLKTEFSSVE